MVQHNREAKMKTSRAFSGVYALLLTPFHEDGSIDWTAYDQYLDWQLAQEPDGLFAVCGSSEMRWLTLEERLELARRAAERAGSLPVVATANLSEERTAHPDELEKMAATGVAGLVLVPPEGLGENQDQLLDYFAGLVDHSPAPALIYEWPTVKPHLVSPEVYGELVAHHGLRGIKDTTCTLEGITAKLACSSEATVFQANAPFLLDAIEAGAGGIMAIVSAAAADLTVAFWRAAHRSTADRVPARPGKHALHEELVALDSTLGRGDAYPATAKHLAALRGVPMSTSLRAPSRLTAEVEKTVELWLSHARRAGILA